MQRQWRFLDTGRGDAAYNMALDEAILLTHDAGRTSPTLRVYGWEVPTLSLGYAQSTAHEVDLAACQQCGVAVVRRPTGGRAVLHDQEVTYSVILPTLLAHTGNTLTEHYRLIGLALEAALQQLGLPVHLERARRTAQTPRDTSSPACFAALARYELSVAGKKIVGSAQKRLQHALLQHGSIPLQMDRHRLFRCLRVPQDRRDALVQEAYSNMTAVNEIATAPVSQRALCEALRRGFAASFGIACIDTPLLPEECRLAEALYATKYATPEWNIEGAAAWRSQEGERGGQGEGETGERETGG
jgi:lipoate-protein ligase A